MAVNRVSPRTTTTGSTSRTPTKKQLQELYADTIDQRTLKKLTKAPAGWEKAKAYDVSRGTLGVGKHAFVINGELYFRTKPVRPNAEATWYKAGKAPPPSAAVGGRGSNAVGGRGSNAVGGRGSNAVGGRGSNAVGGRGSNAVGGRGSTWRPVGGRGSSAGRSVNGRRS